jgi:hypothetical protein
LFVIGIFMKKYSIDDQKLLAWWAADCVERVLFLFEKAYPSDPRPRKAIETCREWVRTGEFKMSVIRGVSLAAHAAAREVKDNLAAFNVARAAGQAVATAHVPQHAFGVFYALRAIAAAFPDCAEEKVLEEHKWQAQHIAAHLHEVYMERVVVLKRKNGLFITIEKDNEF